MLNRIKVSIFMAYWGFMNPKIMNSDMFTMLSDLLALILKVSIEGKHMITHVAFVEVGTDEKHEAVSIWAGAGEGASPIRRIEELVMENKRLVKLLDRHNIPQDTV